MSRIDAHVSAVQRKLMLSVFVEWLMTAALVGAIVALALVVVEKLLRIGVPAWTLWVGLGAVVAVGLVMSIVRRPSRAAAAVAIDERLDLKEKFSTALAVRRSSDPFAQAVVKDAEQTAAAVQLGNKFPLAFPNAGYWAIGLMVIAALTWMFLPAMDLFGREKAALAKKEQERQIAETKQMVKEAIAKVEALPKAVLDTEAVKIAQRQLEELMKHPMPDKAAAARRTMESLSKVDEALKQKALEAGNYAQNQKNAQMFKSMSPPADASGPVSQAHRQIVQGEFEKAAETLKELAKNLDKMEEKEKEKAAEQMKQMADALKQMAQDPKAQEKLKDQLQQMGANQQQIQQAQEIMQKAAQGDQQAQQQIQQMQQQLAQQMNQGQGANQQQMQQLQQAMQQAQQAANAQQQAGQMGQAAQKMAQAMQQAQQGGQAGQQMAQGQQAMQDALDQLDAQQKDQQQMQAARQAMQNAMNQAGAQCDNPGQGDGKGQGQQGQGQWAQGDPKQQGPGMGGAGIGQGGKAEKQNAPFGTKQEVSPSVYDEKGKHLASTFVKDKSIRGEAKLELQKVVEAGNADEGDDVDDTQADRRAQEVKKRYFRVMQEELAKPK